MAEGANGNDRWRRQDFQQSSPRSRAEMMVLENSFASEFSARTGGVVKIGARR